MSTILISEMSNLINRSSIDISFVDASCEIEFEKDTKENIEKLTKVKIRQKTNFLDNAILQCENDTFLRSTLSTPYLEIHSPPPDSF